MRIRGTQIRGNTLKNLEKRKLMYLDSSFEGVFITEEEKDVEITPPVVFMEFMPDHEMPVGEFLEFLKKPGTESLPLQNPLFHEGDGTMTASGHLRRFWDEWGELTRTEQRNWLHQNESAVFLAELEEWQMPLNWKEGMNAKQPH